MLTRLKVSGFKNLVDVDVRFGPFTCIAGANGVGKSNLFDAIRFLSTLAEKPLIEAALSVRDEGGTTADIRSIFHRVGDEYVDEMSFEAEMIIPKEGIDDLGQKVEANNTFLRYSLTLAYRSDPDSLTLGKLEIIKEELFNIKFSKNQNTFLFNHKTNWRRSAIKQSRKVFNLITTKELRKQPQRIKPHEEELFIIEPLNLPYTILSEKLNNQPQRIKQHKEKLFIIEPLNPPRTILSALFYAGLNPTVTLARKEMQSWHLLQLEPSAMRKPDEFISPQKLSMNGSHLAATLYRLAKENRNYVDDEISAEEAEAQIYSQVSNYLAELIDDVREVKIDKDDSRQLLTLMVTDRNGTSYPARSLSDGTLRFLALVVLALDFQAQGLICLEEPENGIHPERITKIIKLLQAMATDVNEPVGIDNPLRQIIINTHSPSVVMQVPDDSLLFAELREKVSSGKRFKGLSFSCLPNTWREKAPEGVNIISKGELLAYLNPIPIDDTEENMQSKPHRVIDREDLKSLIPGLADE
ncbi:MAG TPA: AAA family ATPase [Nostocaceae cyanobacterium]|nr:AAA family ATPase [Nostocaceae cyanobacterium]